MVAGCGNKCLKYIFFVFNFLIFVVGTGIAGLSLWVRFDGEFQKRMAETIREGSAVAVEFENLYVVLYASAALGGLLCLCGFLGCCGACTESVCLLGLFFTVIMGLFIVEVGGALYVFIKKDEVREQISTLYKSQFVSRYDSNEDIRKHLDQVQTKFKCCGASGCGDYANRTAGPPSSCLCADGQPPGCSDALYEALKGNIIIVASVTVGLLALELLAMIFSCVLCSGIRHSAYEYY